MATVDRQHDALQTIFSFFLGLMVVAFIGIGLITFYPAPNGFANWTPEIEAAQQAWRMNTSIILVVLATVVMGVSLFSGDQLKVVSNGLLLGGAFTMLYGMGWTITSDSSYVRFFVVLFSLAVTVGLGYAKFVWLRKGEAPAAVAAIAGSGVVPADISGIAARVAALEARTNAAAAALGKREGY